jgi:hypothetical protein
MARIQIDQETDLVQRGKKDHRGHARFSTQDLAIKGSDAHDLINRSDGRDMFS